MVSDQACLDALREAADRLGESPTKQQYEELGLRPASATIMRRLGGWNAAKEAAGLETSPSSGSRVAPKPDDVDVTVDTDWEDLSVDQRWYYRNRQSDTQYELKRRQRLRRMVHDYKNDSDGCKHCVESDPACLDFHHPPDVDKEMAVNKMIPYGYSQADIRAEMERCVLLCANCHRVEHHDLPVDLGDSAERPTNTATRQELRRWTYAYRQSEGCRDCSVTDPRCLQFHHLDPEEKRGNVGAMISDGASTETVFAEIDRCAVLCVNCHRRIHYDIPPTDA